MSDKRAFNDVLTVGFDLSNGKDETVMVVSRKNPGGSLTVVKALKGPEAMEVYKDLTEKSRQIRLDIEVKGVKPNGEQ